MSTLRVRQLQEMEHIPAAHTGGYERISALEPATHYTQLIDVGKINQENRQKEFIVYKRIGIGVLCVLAFLVFFAFVNQEL